MASSAIRVFAKNDVFILTSLGKQHAVFSFGVILKPEKLAYAESKNFVGWLLDIEEVISRFPVFEDDNFFYSVPADYTLTMKVEKIRFNVSRHFAFAAQNE